MREYDCLAKIGTKEAFTLLLGRLGQMSKGNMHRLELTTKDKNIFKKSLFVADLGGMIVIFLTQNNF